MLFNAPLPHPVLPKFHEGSGMRSVRDSDTNALAWKKNSKTAGQSVSLTNAVAKLQRNVAQMRRKTIGFRAGGAGGGNFNVRGLYVPGTIYNLYDAVIISAGTSTGVYWSVISSNANAPDSGIGWMQVATAQGTWQ
jgi:hypothetical protein